MRIQGKVWGQTAPIFNKNNVEIHRIVGKLGGFCSKHIHQHKWNMFFVESGCLKIKTWMEYGLVDETTLYPENSCVIPPNTPHMFEVLLDDTVAYEVYWVELDPKDIVRENVGGQCPTT